VPLKIYSQIKIIKLKFTLTQYIYVSIKKVEMIAFYLLKSNKNNFFFMYCVITLTVVGQIFYISVMRTIVFNVIYMQCYINNENN